MIGSGANLVWGGEPTNKTYLLSGHEGFLLNCQKLSLLDFKIHFFVFTQEASIEERIQDYKKTGIWQKKLKRLLDIEVNSYNRH